MKKVPAAKMPNLNHLSTSDFERVYEPADDTFLLVDALAAERDLLVARKPALCVEIGCGSGAVITHLASLLPDSAMLASDVNRWALLATAATASANSRRVSTVQADLLSAFRPGSIDVLIFNPPYVPTPDEKAAFAEAAAPVQAWFRDNVDGGNEILDALLAAVKEAEAGLAAGYENDLN